MISILYPALDYEAANIALKVQSLTQNQPVGTYIVPKHYGRNDAEVAKKLSKTEAAIFIANETKELDDKTEQDLSALYKKKIPVKYVIPPGFNTHPFKPGEKDIYSYHPKAHNSSTLITDLSQTVSSLNQQLKKQSPKSTDFSAAGMAAIFIGLTLLLLGLASSQSEDYNVVNEP